MNHSTQQEFSRFDNQPDELVKCLLAQERRVLLMGPSGIGKSYLVGQLARVLAQAGRPCSCLSADPGSPAFG
ncbi:MAG: hypothetical protein H6R47_741, partial [Proteobacteria bacterium]|nr:hypothetical protein [Pseudomonadota bacterium]